jgi:hypothetical protein
MVAKGKRLVDRKGWRACELKLVRCIYMHQISEDEWRCCSLFSVIVVYFTRDEDGMEEVMKLVHRIRFYIEPVNYMYL